MDEHKTKVIFRKCKDNGDIVAFFPDTFADRKTVSSPCRLMSYMHIGQHGEAHIDFYRLSTKPAKSFEYAELLDELQNAVGYNLQVVKRMGY